MGVVDVLGMPQRNFDLLIEPAISESSIERIRFHNLVRRLAELVLKRGNTSAIEISRWGNPLRKGK